MTTKSTKLNTNQWESSGEKVSKVENACLGKHNCRNDHRHLGDDFCHHVITKSKYWVCGENMTNMRYVKVIKVIRVIIASLH